jgi:RluA family pseudouridine synthase
MIDRPTTRSAKLQILYEDADVVAVAKPPGLATIPGRGETDSVLEQLARQLNLPKSGAADPRIRVVHRLDKDTSGVLLMVKNVAAQRHISHQFQNNTVHKEYLAIVSGRPPYAEGEIDAPLAPHRSLRDRMAINPHGKPARTLWKVERNMRSFALIRCFPKTGKTHQIRVHLKSIGLPLAVDPLYRPPPPNNEPGIFLSQYKRDYRPSLHHLERPLIARLTLHAEKLRFAHPSGQQIEIQCPIPKDFRATITQLAKL